MLNSLDKGWKEFGIGMNHKENVWWLTRLIGGKTKVEEPLSRGSSLIFCNAVYEHNDISSAEWEKKLL